jgi:anti-sigma-K factor RskA
MTDDDMHILAGAYALNALSPEEFEPFVEHLNECDSCAVEVREWQATLAELGSSMAVAPPPELRSLVLAGASRLPQLPPLPGLPLPIAPPTEPTEPEEVTPTPRLPRVAPRHVARPSRRRAWLAAAAAVLVIGGTAAGVVVWQNQQQPSQLTVQERIAQVIWAPDVEARSAKVKGGGTITVLASADRGEGVVLAEQLKSIPIKQDYQVWAINAAGNARSLGLLPREPTTPRLLLPGIKAGDIIAITREPAGGSPQPTMKPLGAVTLS